MAYGFRLFYFNITERFARSNQDLNGKFGNQTADRLLEWLLDGLCDDPDLLRAGMPSLKKTADGEDITPPVPSERGDLAIKWTDYNRLSDHHLSAVVRYGRVAGHDLAIGAAGDVDISGRAPSYLFRTELIFPKDGETGILVSEDVDRICPARSVAQWIGKYSQQTAEEGDWWRMPIQAFTDEGRLREMIKNSKKAEVILKRYSKSGSGKRRQTSLKVTAAIEQETERKSVMEAATKWAQGDKEAVANSAAVLSELVGEDVAALDGTKPQCTWRTSRASGRRSTHTGSTRCSSIPSARASPPTRSGSNTCSRNCRRSAATFHSTSSGRTGA